MGQACPTERPRNCSCLEKNHDRPLTTGKTPRDCQARSSFSWESGSPTDAGSLFAVLHEEGRGKGCQVPIPPVSVTSTDTWAEIPQGSCGLTAWQKHTPGKQLTPWNWESNTLLQSRNSTPFKPLVYKIQLLLYTTVLNKRNAYSLFL